MQRTIRAAGLGKVRFVARVRTYRQVEQRILDLAPLVPLYHPINHLAKRANLLRFGPGPLGISNIDISKVHFAAPRSM